MPRPSERTRNKKRINKTAPGGKRTTDFRRKAAAAAHCSRCGRILGGVSNTSQYETQKLNRGKRRIWRLNGGQICHNCLKASLKEAVRTT